MEFLEGLAAPPPEDNVSEAGDDKDQAAAKEPEEKVVLGGLDAGEFDAKVLQQELPVLIAFFGGGDGECDEAVTALESALAPVKGLLLAP